MAAIEVHTMRLRISVKDRVEWLEDKKLIARLVFLQVLIHAVSICHEYTHVAYKRVNNNDITNALTISIAVSRAHSGTKMYISLVIASYVFGETSLSREVLWKKARGGGERNVMAVSSRHRVTAT